MCGTELRSTNKLSVSACLPGCLRVCVQSYVSFMLYVYIGIHGRLCVCVYVRARSCVVEHYYVLCFDVIVLVVCAVVCPFGASGLRAKWERVGFEVCVETPPFGMAVKVKVKVLRYVQ